MNKWTIFLFDPVQRYEKVNDFPFLFTLKTRYCAVSFRFSELVTNNTGGHHKHRYPELVYK